MYVFDHDKSGSSQNLDDHDDDDDGDHTACHHQHVVITPPPSSTRAVVSHCGASAHSQVNNAARRSAARGRAITIRPKTTL